MLLESAKGLSYKCIRCYKPALKLCLPCHIPYAAADLISQELPDILPNDRYTHFLGTPTHAPAAGLLLHSQPHVAFPIILTVLALQAVVLVMAVYLRPYVSPILNFLEAACSFLDTSSLAFTSVVYYRQMMGAGMEGGEGDDPDKVTMVRSHSIPAETSMQHPPEHETFLGGRKAACCCAYNYNYNNLYLRLPG
jgi:hypothetical protein